jgi:hypothetical protein
MVRRIALGLTSLALLLGATGQANAGLIIGSVWENTSAAGNATVANAPGTTPDLTFAMANGAAMDFNSPPSGPSIGDFLNHPTFLTGAGHAGDTLTSNNTTTGTYILFSGSVFVTAGSHTFAVSSDDGSELQISALGIDLNQPGAQTEHTLSQTVTVGATGEYAFKLSYGEVNGLPADLVFTIDGHDVLSTPEPSTMVSASMAGLVGIGCTWYRRRRAKVVA